MFCFLWPTLFLPSLYLGYCLFSRWNNHSYIHFPSSKTFMKSLIWCSFFYGLYPSVYPFKNQIAVHVSYMGRRDNPNPNLWFLMLSWWPPTCFPLLLCLCKHRMSYYCKEVLFLLHKTFLLLENKYGQYWENTKQNARLWVCLKELLKMIKVGLYFIEHEYDWWINFHSDLGNLKGKHYLDSLKRTNTKEYPPGLSMKFSRQEYWSWSPFPSPGRIFPTQGLN